jgi:hypothetical protein
MIQDDFVIFRHFHVRGYWELSGKLYTTYLVDGMITSDNKTGLTTMLNLHGIKASENLIKDLERYTKDPQDDMFIVELKSKG